MSQFYGLSVVCGNSHIPWRTSHYGKNLIRKLKWDSACLLGVDTSVPELLIEESGRFCWAFRCELSGWVWGYSSDYAGKNYSILNQNEIFCVFAEGAQTLLSSRGVVKL